MALCHKVLVILNHLWRDKKHYTYVGAEYFDNGIRPVSSGIISIVWDSLAIRLP